MGGDSFGSSPPSTEDVSLSSQGFPHGSVKSSASSGDEECLCHKLENGSVINCVRVSDSGDSSDADRLRNSIREAAERQKLKVYTEVLRSYEDLQSKIERFEEAKSTILSYTPGSWADKASCMDLRECDVPNTTSFLVIGPKSSGKSSLVNKISRVFEDDVFQPPRAQVSCSSSPEDGTYFLHEYSIPRNSGSFCLYDTPGLSADSSKNLKMIERWMTHGVHHGELIIRESDSKTLKAQLKCRARRGFFSGQVRPIDFVIFVVNGLSVLESMNSADEMKKAYSQMIGADIKNPLLLFKDDKPAIVVTHGDLLPISDRVRVRVYLGELLGVPPTGQIFDIPENDDPATTSAIFDLLFYCLERADRNLPARDLFTDKVRTVASLLFWIAAAIIIIWAIPGRHRVQPRAAPTLPLKVDWHKIRHLWLED
ncbi:uncharacterized protein LOC131023231 [Salvia miltiorrhiza]|uniref:uncharacterized protein LOC131023231 n=1 Tax=Salvia miltiorrhiza TaxID=226208 RepID=UPI0025ABC9CB|nr:uncharacterized protein LOC131023231 [Salvia miltiorrhiza]